MRCVLQPDEGGGEGVVNGSRADPRALCADQPSSGAVGLAVREMVPAHLLDGGEVVYFATKPSPWFVLLVSSRWVAAGILLALVGGTSVVPSSYQSILYQTGFWITAARLAWATLEWVSRLYVLTNRRVMRIRGVFNVDLFECSLDRIENTSTSLTLWERVVRVGTVSFETAGGGASWRMVSRALELHERLREAIGRAKNRGSHDV